jgi:serine/threonine protein kinase
LDSDPSGLYCPSCQAKLRHNSKFCWQCGALLSTDEAPPSDFSIPPSPVVIRKVNHFSDGGLLPTQIIADRYLILEKIAQGGMGAIYKAQDQRLNNKVVAFKEIVESAIAAEERKEVLASFTREAEILARLSHPNLVRVTDLFEAEDYRYLVMEFVDGKTIEQIMQVQSAPFRETRMLNWARQLCDVLHYLHSQNPPIIYRDIKPSNIMVVSGTDQVKVIDFGIARFYKTGKRRDTIQFGTDGYAPPEQYGQTQTDARADVYALGATLHQLLTLRDPQTKLFEFPPVRKLNPSVSPRVNSAIQKAVEPNRQNRHASMLAFWRALSDEPLRTSSLSSFVDEVVSPVKVPQFDAAIDHSGAADNVTVMPELSLGDIRRGSSQVIFQELDIPPGCAAGVSASVPWMTVQPSRVEPDGGKVTVRMLTNQLDTQRLLLDGNPLSRWLGWHTSRLVPIEKQHQGAILLNYEDDTIEQYPVSLIVQPQLFGQIMGWAITLILLLLEVVIPLGVLFALIRFIV